MKPILFSTNMVQAILDGRKTQTRRVIIPQPDRFFEVDDTPGNFHLYDVEWGLGRIYPKYQVGDILWVRESWCENRGKYFYKADNICNGCTEDGICLPEGVAKHITCELCEDRDGYIKWRPSIHMPRTAARIFLRVTDVQVERVQEITEEDARAEGMSLVSLDDRTIVTRASYREAFRWAWDSIYAAKGYGWDVNSWVFVYEFERCDKEGK